MIVEFDEPTGRVSAQCPDIHLALYPAGHKLKDGKDDFYRGAFVVSRGSERVHLNALDITDLFAFFALDITDLFAFFDDAKVADVRKVMTKEYVATNLLRMLVTESVVEDPGDES